jgi:hypothetical protein
MPGSIPNVPRVSLGEHCNEHGMKVPGLRSQEQRRPRIQKQKMTDVRNIDLCLSYPEAVYLDLECDGNLKKSEVIFDLDQNLSSI